MPGKNIRFEAGIVWQNRRLDLRLRLYGEPTNKGAHPMAVKKKAPAKAAKEIQKAQPARALSPFEAMDRMMDQMFESHFPRGWLRPFRMEWPAMSEGMAPFEGKTPKVDVIDRDDEVVVKAELPGVDKKDVDVSVTRNTVTIKGATSHEEKEEKGHYYRCEMSRGAYARTVMLPSEVDESKAKAKFKDGVLELTLPKQEKAKAKRHTVKVE
jgi:HSP20 family protein